MAAQKYVRLKNRNGHIIDWHRELHIIPEDMEVFEYDGVPPERIENLLDWKVSLIDQEARTIAASRKKQPVEA